MEYVPGGFMSFSYIDITIETLPFEWKVIRRETDLIKFREYLVKKFPQYVIPPLFLQKSLDEASMI